jgi:hypothetical protein
MLIKKSAITSKFSSNAFLLAVLLVILQVGSASAQSDVPQANTQKSYRVINQEIYNRILDELFPRDDPEPDKTVFELILRFRPSFRPTSQIVIRRRVDKVQVVEYTSLDGNIYAKLNEILQRGGNEDLLVMAKSIKVKRTEINVPLAQVQQWYSTFFDSLNTMTRTLREKGKEFDKTGGSETILLDGTSYDLWYRQRVHKLDISLYDIEVDTPGTDGEFRLVQWMNSVRRDVRKLKK